MTGERTFPRIAVSSLLLASFLLLAAGRSRAEDSLTLWVHPYLPATELTRRFNPLAEYLSLKVGLPISVRVQKSYKSHIERTGNDEADIAYVGPVSYVKIVETYGEKPLLARLAVRGEPVFFGMIIVREDSSIRSLEELAGRSFAFGDTNSTMSHLVPRYMLEEGGVPVGRLGKYEFLGSHHNVALAVLGGYFDAGGVKEEVYYEYRERGLRMLAKSPPIAEHVFMTKSSLPAEIQGSLRKAMLTLHEDPRGVEILTSLKSDVTALVKVDDDDYDSLRKILSMPAGGP
jgi:phosphonate transport system substrate-binding protein